MARQRRQQMLCTFQREADHVDDDVGFHSTHGRAEITRPLHGGPIHLTPIDGSPGVVCRIRLCRAAADRDDVVTGFHQTGNEIGSDMARCPDYQNPHHRSSLGISVSNMLRPQVILQADFS
jgi:hypothetical protein